MMTLLPEDVDAEMTTAPTLVTSSSSSSSSPSSWRPNAVQLKLVVNVYVVSTLCLCGIVGNVLSVVVLGRDRSIRRTTALLLRALGVADTVYLVTCLLFQTVKTIYQLTDWLPTSLRRVWPYAEPFVWPLASVAQTCNVWLVVLLTADRYVAICRPLHAAQYRY